MITIVDYEAGNITSVERALTRLGLAFRTLKSAEAIRGSDQIIFPGVGHAKSAMDHLTKSGIGEVLREEFLRGVPFLGICLGSQIILDHSDEGPTRTLGLARGTVRFFPDFVAKTHTKSSDSKIQSHADFTLKGERYKVPHMGWNNAIPTNSKTAQALFQGISPETQFYFVHSYFTLPEGQTETLCETDYGLTFASGLAHKNLVSVQFHPEKSGESGLKLLTNFANWRP